MNKSVAANAITLFVMVTQIVTTTDAFTTNTYTQRTPLGSGVSVPTGLALSRTNSHSHSRQQQLLLQQQQHSFSTVLQMSKVDDDENEIERLRSMAAKLRAEAAQLEAQQRQAVADAAAAAFQKFDTNQDGQISMEELKAGLEKTFKMELPEKRVQQLLENFDKTGDNVLDANEFVTIEQFRNRLDALVREEKLAAKQALDEAKQQETAMKMIQAQLEMINDQPPTASDKILSVLPYLFPLLDGLQFARFLVIENPDNVLASLVALTYGLYRAIPFGGFIAFFALNFLAGNPRINRLIRFNMQQAIFVDIALFFPGLLAALYSLIAQAFGSALPASVTEIGTDAIFGVLLITIAYASISSLLGITPDKIPILSKAVNDRMPTIDMFDDQGRFNPRRRLNEENDDTSNDEKK